MLILMLISLHRQYSRLAISLLQNKHNEYSDFCRTLPGHTGDEQTISRASHALCPRAKFVCDFSSGWASCAEASLKFSALKIKDSKNIHTTPVMIVFCYCFCLLLKASHPRHLNQPQGNQVTVLDLGFRSMVAGPTNSSAKLRNVQKLERLKAGRLKFRRGLLAKMY